MTRRSEPKSTTPTWPASRFMHMPLTPEANLRCVSSMQTDKQTRQVNLLDKLLGLDVGHAVHTGDTITIFVRSASQFPFSSRACSVFQRHPAMASTSVPSGPCVVDRQGSLEWKRTRRTERGRSRQGSTPPGHRGFSARELTRPRLARPSLRRMCGFGGQRRRVRHFAVGDQLA